MRQTILSILITLAIPFHGFSQQESHKSSLLQYDKQIDGILKKMTLEEKVNMFHGKFQFASAGVERLGIADIKYADGPFGIREELEPHGWSPLGWEKDSATFFPTGSALAATWSAELAHKYGTGMAREARIRGKDVILGPAINIQRIPTGGRTYEYLSEDPFLSAQLAEGYVRGVQENGVAACPKHFALNNQEDNRGTVNVIVGERAMREIYLPPFKAAVQADAYAIMSAYNKVNGWWCGENEELLSNILRDEWGFAGFVVSDWNGTHSTVPAIEHGLNVEMPGNKFLGEALLDSVKAGLVSEEVINQRARELLRVRLAIQPIPESEANLVMTSQPAQQQIAYEIASKSIVLLKNENVLPLRLAEKPVIAVIGGNATEKMATGGLGAGVKALYEITPLEGIKDRVGDKAKILYARGYEPVKFSFADLFAKKTKEQLERETQQKAKIAEDLSREAVEVASKADIIIFIGGNNRSVETEGSDRLNILLPAGQDELIQKIAAVNSNIITVLTSGAPNDLNVIKPLSKALLISWFNGSEGGNALADVLLGTITPSGRLPFTLPVKLEDSPAFALDNYVKTTGNTDVFAGLVADKEAAADGTGTAKGEKDPDTARYSEGFLVGYRWFDTKGIEVAYPFGFGLTYTSFSYADLKTEKDTYGNKDVIRLSFELVNSGSVAADEVPQVYVHRINPGVEWPYKELKAFSRVTLQPGETKRVTMEIPVKNLRYWDEKSHAWTDDLCEIELQVGASAGDILLSKRVQLK